MRLFFSRTAILNDCTDLIDGARPRIANFTGTNDAKHINRFFEQYVKMVTEYLESARLLWFAPVFRWHFSRLWDIPMLVLHDPDMSQRKIKRMNSASLLMSGEVLRPLGMKYGAIKAETR